MGQPYLNRVVLEREENNTVAKAKKSGIIIPENVSTTRLDPAKGTILQVGPECSEELKSAVGRDVLFAQYAGAYIVIDEETRFICNDEDILYIMGE